VPKLPKSGFDLSSIGFE